MGKENKTVELESGKVVPFILHTGSDSGNEENRFDEVCGDLLQEQNRSKQAYKIIREVEKALEQEWGDSTHDLGEKVKALHAELKRSKRFIDHIQSHLEPGEKVICKICGKTADEITEEVTNNVFRIEGCLFKYCPHPDECRENGCKNKSRKSV